MKFRSRRAKLASLGLAPLLLAAAPGAALSQEAAADAGKATPADPNKVVATVDGQPVTEADLSQAIQDLDQQFARLPEEQKRAAALSAVIEIRLLAAEAKAKGLDQSEEYKRRSRKARAQFASTVMRRPEQWPVPQAS